MSTMDPAASLSTLASTDTERTVTPTSSAAHLLPVETTTNTSTYPSSPSQPTASRSYPRTTPQSETYPTNPNKPPKDYEQAFASLSSAWGFGASVPAKNPKSDKDKKVKRKKDKKTTAAASPPSSSPPSLSSNGVRTYGK